LRDAVSRIGAQRILLLIDACKSGGSIDAFSGAMDARSPEVGREAGIAIRSRRLARTSSPPSCPRSATASSPTSCSRGSAAGVARWAGHRGEAARLVDDGAPEL